MIHVLHLPPPPLGLFIHSFWVAEAYTGRTARERILPTGSEAIVIHLEDRPVQLFADATSAEAVDANGAILIGARQTPLVISTSLGPTVGIHFRPGGARTFLGYPASDFTERTVPLDAAWGRQAELLREQLSETTNVGERLRLVERVLLARARSLVFDPTVGAALAAFDEPDLDSVAEVNRRTGLSPKRLIALFQDHVGLSPKVMWRLKRFRAALHDLENGASRGAALASAHGYFDQAHFLRDFRCFAGMCPGDYLASRIVGSDHVAIAG